MKVFPAVVFFLVYFVSGYASFAQDTATSSIQAPVRTISSDTSIHKTGIAKKIVKHKHAVTDSTSISTDTSLHHIAKKTVRHKHVITDSASLFVDSNGIIRTADTPVHHVAVRTVKHKHAVLDSLGHIIGFSDTAAGQDISVVKPLKHKRVILSDSARAAIRDSVFRSDSLNAVANKIYRDSVNRHWTGWKKYQVMPGQSYSLYSKRVLKGKSKSELQYNIADFYLYLNGQLVMPPIAGYGFFAAGCLCFKYDDTLLLNSGLGSKVGVGVGIKIIGGRFTGTLHANKHNEEIYKLSEDDSVYVKNVIAVPIVQSLKLRREPSYQSDDVIIGEYHATYKKFYQKNEDEEDSDEGRQYMVRIIFRCRVSGGIDSMKSLGGANSK